MASEKIPKAQSAMEYLMTYGWAILVILVVLGILYLLHVFSPGGLLGTTCTVNFQYFCGNPVLASNGTVSFVAGQNTDATEDNIGFACTGAVNSSTGGPYTFNGESPWFYLNATGKLNPTYNISNTFSLASSSKVNVNGLPCFSTTGSLLAQNAFVPVGTSFSGFFWVEYTKGSGAPGTTGTPWIITQLATVTMPVSAHSNHIYGGTTTIASSSTTVAGGTTTAGSGSTTIGSGGHPTTTAAVVVMTTTPQSALLPVSSQVIIAVAIVIIIVVIVVLYLRGRLGGGKAVK